MADCLKSPMVNDFCGDRHGRIGLERCGHGRAILIFPDDDDIPFSACLSGGYSSVGDSGAKGNFPDPRRTRMTRVCHWFLVFLLVSLPVGLFKCQVLMLSGEHAKSTGTPE